MSGQKTTVSGWSAGSDPPIVMFWQILILLQQILLQQLLLQQPLLQQPPRQPLGRHHDDPCHAPVAVAIERQHYLLKIEVVALTR